MYNVHLGHFLNEAMLGTEAPSASQVAFTSRPCVTTMALSAISTKCLGSSAAKKV